MGKLKVKPKNDVAFKKIFADEELLKALIISALNLQGAKKITLKPNEITPSNPNEKFCRLDVRAEIDGREVDIEIQLTNRDDFRARALYYWALLFTHLPMGEDYEKLPQTVVISIVDFNIFGSSDYHSMFRLEEVKRREVLTDKLEIHFFELKKIPSVPNAQKEIEYWLNLIGAETEDDIKSLEEVQSEGIKNALTEVLRLNKDEEFVRTVEAREVQLREEQSALSAENRKAKRETAANLLEMGLSVEQISKATGLTIPELRKIQTLNEIK